MTRDQLLVGVISSRSLFRWQARCIEALAAVPGVKLERWLQVPADLPPGSARRAAGAMVVAPVPDVLLALRRDDQTLSPPALDDGQRLDVVLDLTFGGMEASIPLASEWWRFGYGMDLIRDPARAALVDYVRGPGVTRVALVSDPAGVIIREGWLQTVSWWTGNPLDRLLLDPAAWPAIEALRRIDPATGTPSGIGGEANAGWVTSQSAPRRREQGLPSRVLKVAAAGRRMKGWPAVLTRHIDWNVGIVQAPIGAFLVADEVPDITWLPKRPGRFAADPFGLVRGDVLHVLFEDFSQRRGRGSIFHTAVSPDGTISAPECVLDPGAHASYPFLVEHEGTVFMLPEIASSGELVLYEAVDFPYRWRPAVTMLPGIPAVDASVVEFGGRWWLFATRLDRGANQNLFVWHAPHLTGPWTEHAANPVKTDARSARPGGTPFVVEGRLYRPSQDNSRRYGGRVILNRVDLLTPTTFDERPVKAIGPRQSSGYPDGLHTLSAAGDRTLVDGNSLHFVFDVLRRNVASKLPGRPAW